jgi:lycopene cyclase domain-containing protein
MTYFVFLAIFLVIPLLVVGGLTWRDRQRHVKLPPALQNWPAWLTLAGHVLVALIYTTPWDNYLVATGVWWYDPQLVTGVLIGWVPIEEYIFFILQPLLTGLWLLFLARRLPVWPASTSGLRHLRPASTALAGLVWLAMVSILVAGWQPGTYLALELGWALPPIMLQLAFGADILWRHRRLILLTWLPATLYLSAADAIAIGAGTWTIDPAQSLNIYLGGVLPVEEFLFFGLTNALLTFGMVLVLARQSQMRLDEALARRPAWRNLLRMGSSYS